MARRFERHARTVSLLTLLSRVTGLVRDAVLSRVFGVGPLMDAFFFAFLIPNLFRRLFGEGALAAAFLPVYAQLDRDDPAVARRLASLTVAVLVVSLGAVALAGEAALWTLMQAPIDADSRLAVRLTMLTLPYMPLVCLVALLGAMLHVHGRFGPPAAAPVILNVLLIAAAAGLAPLLDADVAAQRVMHITVVAGAVVLAGVLQVTWSLLALREHAWWRGGRAPAAAARAPLRRVLWQAGPMILGLGVLQVNTFLDGLIASYPVTVGPTIFGLDYPLQPGAMAVINYAQRLYQFPLAVFGLAVATAIFPQLARQRDDLHGFTDTIRRGLRLVVFIGLPASAGLILVREPLAVVILQGGAFSFDDAERVAFVLLGYAPAIWAYAMVHVLTRAFYARGDAMTPVVVAVGIVVLNTGLNLGLIWTPLREAALAWSTAACSIVQVTVLTILARRHTGRLIDGAVGRSWARTAALTAVMAAAVWPAAAAFGDQPARWGAAAAELAVAVAIGILLVAAGARLLRMPELTWAIGRSS